MADIKIITATAKEYTIPIDNTIKETVVIEPVIQGSISEPLIQGQLSDPAFEIVLSNYGEDSILEPILFKFNEDFSSVNEVVILNPNKITYETLQSSESNLKLIGKGFNESGITSDFIYFNASKEITETGVASEQYLSLFAKAQIDSSTVFEVFSSSAVFNRTVLDSVFPTDDVLGEANIDDDQYAFVGKSVFDDLITSEVFITTNLFNRVLVDNSIISETIINAFSKNLQETSTTSELFATTINFDRNLTNTATGSDVVIVVVSFNPTLLDNTTSTDVLSTLMLFNREIADSTTSIEDVLFSIGYGRILIDTTTSSDIFSNVTAFNRDLFDTPLSTDVINTISDFNRIPLETATSNELFSISAFNKQLTDFVSISDSSSLIPLFGRIENDTVYASDDVLGAASIDDEQYAFVGKTLDIELLNATDTTYLLTAKTFLELSATVESGLIYNQGYFANAYVTPGYVGQIRVF
jgi:hypothetical protein